MPATLVVQQQAGLRASARRQLSVYGREVAEEMWSGDFFPDKSRRYAIDATGRCPFSPTLSGR